MSNTRAKIITAILLTVVCASCWGAYWDGGTVTKPIQIRLPSTYGKAPFEIFLGGSKLFGVGTDGKLSGVAPGSDLGDNVKIVDPGGPGYTTIAAALAAITDASVVNPYVILVAPGVATKSFTGKDYVRVVFLDQTSAAAGDTSLYATKPFGDLTDLTAAEIDTTPTGIGTSGNTTGHVVGIDFANVLSRNLYKDDGVTQIGVTSNHTTTAQVMADIVAVGGFPYLAHQDFIADGYWSQAGITTLWATYPAVTVSMAQNINTAMIRESAYLKPLEDALYATTNYTYNLRVLGEDDAHYRNMTGFYTGSGYGFGPKSYVWPSAKTKAALKTALDSGWFIYATPLCNDTTNGVVVPGDDLILPYNWCQVTSEGTPAHTTLEVTAYWTPGFNHQWQVSGGSASTSQVELAYAGYDATLFTSGPHKGHYGHTWTLGPFPITGPPAPTKYLRVIIRNASSNTLVASNCIRILATGELDPATNPYQSMPAVSWIKANFHSHSTNSDGLASPTEVLEEYRAAGFDVASISDHNVVTKSSGVYLSPTASTVYPLAVGGIGSNDKTAQDQGGVGLIGHSSGTAGVLGVNTQDGSGVVGIQTKARETIGTTPVELGAVRAFGMAGVLGSSPAGTGVVGVSKTGAGGAFHSYSGTGVWMGSDNGAIAHFVPSEFNLKGDDSNLWIANSANQNIANFGKYGYLTVGSATYGAMIRLPVYVGTSAVSSVYTDYITIASITTTWYVGQPVTTSLTPGVTWVLADANDASCNVVLGLIGYAVSGATTQLTLATSGVMYQAASSDGWGNCLDTGTALVAGTDYYLSETAGKITLTPPTNVVRIGRAIDTTHLFLRL